jgi:hypothetical protein
MPLHLLAGFAGILDGSMIDMPPYTPLRASLGRLPHMCCVRGPVSGLGCLAACLTAGLTQLVKCVPCLVSSVCVLCVVSSHMFAFTCHQIQ